MPDAIIAVGRRHEAFARLPSLSTRIGGLARVCDIKPAALAQIEELVRKIHGKRHHRVNPADRDGHFPASHQTFSASHQTFTDQTEHLTTFPASHQTFTDQTEHLRHIPAAHQTFAASHRTFTDQIEHLMQLIELVEGQPGYLPSVADLTPPALRLYAGELASLNRMAFTAESTLATARRERNEILYAPVTGMIDTALAVKEYVKGVFGAASPEFKEVNHIHFQGKKI
jgi:hypothetical protein